MKYFQKARSRTKTKHLNADSIRHPCRSPVYYNMISMKHFKIILQHCQLHFKTIILHKYKLKSYYTNRGTNFGTGKSGQLYTECCQLTGGEVNPRGFTVLGFNSKFFDFT